MDKNILKSLVLRLGEEFVEVIKGRVHAAVAAKAEEMKFFATALDIVISGGYLLVLQELVLAAGDVDLHQVLVNDAACTEVHVSYFGISHLSVRKTDILSAGVEVGIRIFCPQGVDEGLTLSVNRIAVVVATFAPTVKNH